MNILSLEITNHKAIKSFLLDADGKNIEIAGDTASGKTTAISALWDILSKGRDVLRHGEKKGSIRVVIGDKKAAHYVAERVTTPSKSTVSIHKMLGQKALPMDMKDFEDMISKLSINPHKIKDMKPVERVKTLLQAAECDIDLEALDAQIEEAEQERLLAGRSANSSKPVEVPEETKPVSVSALIAERDKLQQDNTKIEGTRKTLDDLVHSFDGLGVEIAELEMKLEQANAARVELHARIEKGSEWAKVHQPVPTLSLDEKIKDAEEINRKAAIYEQAVKDKENHDLLQAVRRDADEKVKELREQKKKALENIHWPLPGLSVEDGAVSYNGVLLENLGESEQMLACAAIALGDIEKHEIKVVRMDGVESMSKKDYEALRGLFNARGVQVLSTRVCRDDAEEGEIVIEEGCYGVADKS